MCQVGYLRVREGFLHSVAGITPTGYSTCRQGSFCLYKSGIDTLIVTILLIFAWQSYALSCGAVPNTCAGCHLA